jgi:hypothetical protein
LNSIDYVQSQLAEYIEETDPQEFHDYIEKYLKKVTPKVKKKKKKNLKDHLY